jgi:hypothetical protein
MPLQDESEDIAKLEALRAAANVGLDAMAAGRHRSFNSKESLNDDLVGLAEKVLGRGRWR